MKECLECGKKLGIIEGYHHPIMGKNYLLCSVCFDTVYASVEKWSEFITPYIGFFSKNPKKSDNRLFGKDIIKQIKKTQNKSNSLWSGKINQNAN